MATDFNNLAMLLLATNHLAAAEPLMRRHLEIFLNFTPQTGYPHPNLEAAIRNYASVLKQMGIKQEEIRQRLEDMQRAVV